jgi:hypothetical protein
MSRVTARYMAHSFQAGPFAEFFDDRRFAQAAPVVNA